MRKGERVWLVKVMASGGEELSLKTALSALRLRTPSPSSRMLRPATPQAPRHLRRGPSPLIGFSLPPLHLPAPAGPGFQPLWGDMRREEIWPPESGTELIAPGVCSVTAAGDPTPDMALEENPAVKENPVSAEVVNVLLVDGTDDAGIGMMHGPDMPLEENPAPDMPLEEKNPVKENSVKDTIANRMPADPVSLVLAYAGPVSD